MLIAIVALCIGQAFAQPSAQPSYSADELYNLGNSYARADKPGLAVLSYERAALLAPGDADINANLAYVRATAHVLIEPRSRFASIVQAIASIVQAIPPGPAAWLGVLGMAVAGIGLMAIRRKRLHPGMTVAAVLLGLALMALTAANAMLLWPRMHEAVVLIDQTPVRVSPVPMGDTAFVLREAESVTIIAEHDEYLLIRTAGGLSGWVARAAMGAVVPSPSHAGKTSALGS
jgi:hypothetical protein